MKIDHDEKGIEMTNIHQKSSPTDFVNSDFKNPTTKLQTQRLKRMEGELRIVDTMLLEINYPKMVLFLVLMTLSVVGLLLLKYFIKLRAILFYDKVKDSDLAKATHIYVEGTGKVQEIAEISKESFFGKEKDTFLFRKLKYEFIGGECYPVGMHYIDGLQPYLKEEFMNRGVSTEEAISRQRYFGTNQHLVQVPGYFQYMFDVMTKPFFIFQYFVCFIWIVEGVLIFGVMIVVFAYLTTSINYILLRRSYNKIKETAEKIFKVRVWRDSQFKEVNNTDLVPGDLYIPCSQIPCDSIVIKGQLFVDEVSLTGENVPIPKTHLIDVSKVQESSHWLFEGSKLETMKEGTLAIVIHVGFGSRRGRIIRKILTKVIKQPEYFTKLLIFLLQVWIVALVLYLATFWMMFDLQVQASMIVIRFFDFITYSFPAPFPIFFQLAYSFCLVRLNRDEIVGTESEKTIESSRMRTLCFDKTGTLTETKMEMSQVHAFSSSKQRSNITKNTASHELITDLFASCHSVEEINGDLKGDQIDLRMFEHTKAEIAVSRSQEVVRQIKVDGRVLQVLKINQYESRFQSMSVLFRSKESGRLFIACKGSPQKIQGFSKLKIQSFDDFIKSLSLGGYRSIAFGFKEISNAQIGGYMVAQRSQFLQDITVLGVAAFGNQLKSDAVETIQTLTECGVNTKIITGDNIFLGVKTAMMTRMVPEDYRVVVIEGAKYQPQTGRIEVTELIQQEAQVKSKVYTLEHFKYLNEPRQVYAIDNAFLQKNEHFLHNKVKIFARITPEHKGMIVKRHVELQTDKIERRSCWQNLVGEASLKVGMVGDGANDLIAIKEANVGIGFSSCDAVYSASFAVSSLSHIVTIIREAKNVERQVLDMVQYFSFLNFLSIISTIMQTNDASYYTSGQLLYRNFALILPITLFMGLTLPSDRLTRWMPCSNFMGRQNQLVFWGNCIIYSAALILGYRLLRESDAFVPNSQPVVTFSSGFNGENMSATLMFLLTSAAYLIIVPFLHTSDPWKDPFYKNVPMMIVIILNVVLIPLMFFFTEKLSFMGLVEIPDKWAAIELGVIVGFGLVAGLYTLFIQGLVLHEKEEEESELTQETIIIDK